MSAFKVEGTRVLITGATSGIGLELGRLFAMNGYELVIIGRDESRLQALQESWFNEFGVQVYPLAKDLSSVNAPQEIVDWLQKKQLHIDTLINNAGFGAYGPFIETQMEMELEMIQVNIMALTQLTKLLVPAMKEKGYGKILNVSSVAAFQPGGPLMAVYYATKSYVLSFSEALSNELADVGILVSVLCPGPTATEFIKRANLGESKVFQSNLMSAEEVARIGYCQFHNGKTVIVPGTKNRILARSSRFFPRKVVTGIVRKMQERRKPNA